ncbi:PD-(D/E)XK nuclease family protein [Aureispira anguillae]|uniref:PD-(D/E)XK nuclease family protein n=1 Tax=Aureispira anguillae TaxID=2864201 RepID=A0A915YIM1_9BACT|nr:PD-(D/E)XK nuclease family protein [Aureispira anguillae]BDS13895.1 PD-(D/E)XK nuclease family protein [Aureispira anguillae]
MVIQFGLEIEERTFPEYITVPEEVGLACGVNGLMTYLEKHLGISYPERHDYLRFEQYRQILLVHLSSKNNVAFYAASFKADQMATAIALLNRRDELLMGGWDFELEEGMPTRLRTLAEVEALVKAGEPTGLFDGFAERFRRVLHFVRLLPLPIKTIYLNEPLELLPPYLQELFATLEEMEISLVQTKQPIAPAEGDLQNFQKALLKEPYNRHQVKADGSLLIVQAKRETYAAEYWAKLFLENKTYRPVCLIPDKNRALDNTLIEEGLPSLGILSASIARPTLQILKLVSAFLWKPINPYKILEFVSLPNTPIHPALARGIAKIMAQKPGLFSGAWNAMVRQFFDYYDEKIAETPTEKEALEKEREEAQEEYRFWFNRRRYDTAKSVPKSEVIELYRYVSIWARKEEDEHKKQIENLQKRLDNPSTPHQKIQEIEHYKEDLQNGLPALEGLRVQSNNIVQVLEALPDQDTQLSNLRLERLVRTINEPAAIRFRSTELGHLPYVHKGSAIVRPTEEVFWWNFVDVERETGFARWYKKEQAYLMLQTVVVETPVEENARMLWQRMQAVLRAQKRLVLVMPQYIEGKEQLPHPLWGDLNAALGDKALKRIIVNLDTQENIDFLAKSYALPTFIRLMPNVLNKPRPYLAVAQDKNIQQVETESFSSLDSLLYYPYQWVFRYQVKFKKSSMLSVVKDRVLKGNIAHSVFEQLFNAIKDSSKVWSKKEVVDWVSANVSDLFEREGAVLLMYGQEAERIGLVNKIKQAAWALVLAIQENGWTIVDTELPIVGKVAGQELKGIVDLVLQRQRKKGNELIIEKAIVDLKWGGATYRKQQFKNGEDLQLVIYSKLLEQHESWAHTAYFIIESGKIIARNNLAFDSAETVAPDVDYKEIHQMIWTRIEKTYQWRMQQIKNGEIEVRTETTVDELEELMQERTMDSAEFLDLLEMKKGRAKYDDYQVLINMVR